MKILIFIEGNEYIRNYLTTGAFNELKDHQVNYIVSERVTMTEAIVNSGAKLFRLDSKSFSFACRLSSQLQMYDRSKKNKNFIFRLRRELIKNTYSLFVVPNQLRISEKNYLRMKIEKWFCHLDFLKKSLLFFLGVVKITKNVFLETLGLIRYFLIVLIVKLKLKSIIVNLLWNFVPLNSGIKHIIVTERPDLLMMPNSVIGVDSYELMRACDKSGFTKTLVLVDNWDNLSSKSAFIKNPDYLGVWGKQSLAFSSEFHEMQPEKVRIIGTPRFVVYENYKKNSLNNNENVLSINQPYILFAGCAVEFDEIGALKSVAKSLETVKKSLPQDVIIVYRPHPWGKRSTYLKQLIKNPINGVVVDPQILINKDVVGMAFQPSLNYYPQLLDKALFIICPLSTMVIESTIMNKQVLALAHEDSLSLLSPNRILANYKHFEGLEKLSNITIVPNLDSLPKDILNAYEKRSSVNLKEELDFFVSIDSNNSYASRIANYVNDIESEIVPGKLTKSNS